ncbi:MAG: family 10 glycosylhydrolase [Clostridia bacterium]|nr:family 10 glycosylhydrolase [Clostridia bacterium]
MKKATCLLICLALCFFLVPSLVIADSSPIIDAKIKQVQDAMDSAKKQYLYCDYEYVESVIAQLQALSEEYAAASAADKSGISAEADELVKKGVFACYESRTVEYRAIWVRPTQKSQQEVSTFIQTLYDNGINTVGVETLYNSTLIFPAPEGSDFIHNPSFNGFDVLGAYVEECHARGMELHVWMPVFYNTHTGSEYFEDSVWVKNPEWHSINNSGKDVPVNGGNSHRYLNPAHPDVQDFLLDTYRYILENYDIDAFELDYIRYRESDGDDYGYDEITIAGFQAEYETDVVPTYDRNATWWNDWTQYRCDIISRFIKRIRDMFDEVAPDVLLCADVMDDPTNSISHCYQDYAVWVREGWIDLLKPMSYSLGAVNKMGQHVERMKGKYVSAGIASFEGYFNNYDIATHVANAFALGADGVQFFESNAYLNKGNYEYLGGTGVFRNRAISPNLDIYASSNAVVDYAIGRINDVIEPLNGLDKSKCNELRASLTALKLDLGSKSKADVITVANDIISSLGDGAADKAIAKDLKYLCRILENSDAELPMNAKIMLGDVNNDGDINQYDYILVVRHYFETRVLTEEEMILADVNADGAVNQYDYILIRRHYFGTYTIQG